MSARPTYRKSTIPAGAECVFTGIIFDVYQWEQELYDGSKTTFEKLARPDTAIVYPVLEDGKILLIEDTQPASETYVCAPMGRVDPGETNEEAARRELLEETGCSVEQLLPLYEFEPHLKIDWMIYAYVGKGVRKVQDANPGPGERILLHPVTLDQLIEMASEGNFDDPRLHATVLEAKLDPSKMAALRTLFSNERPG